MLRRGLVTAAITASALTMVAPAEAQFGGELKEYKAFVLVQGASGITSTQVWGIAANAVRQKLRRASDAKPGGFPPPKSVSLSPATGRLNQGMGSDDAEINLLAVSWAIDTEISEEQMAQAWEAARGELERTIQSIQRMGRESQQMQKALEIKQLESQRELLKQEIENALAKLTEVKDQAGGDQEHFEAAHAEAQKRLREFKLQQISVEARREAIEKQIDELRSKKEAVQAEDAIVGELRKIVAIRDKQLAAIRAIHENAGAVTESEVSEAEGTLAQARVDLIKAQRSAEEQAGGPLLRGLNDELTKVVIQAAEVEAQLKLVEEMVKDLAGDVSQSLRSTAEAYDLHQQVKFLQGRRSQMEQRLVDRKHETDSSASDVSIRALKDLPYSEGQTGEGLF